MPESEEVLLELVPDYPLGHALVVFGILIVLIIEQTIMMVNRPRASDHTEYSNTLLTNKEKDLELASADSTTVEGYQCNHVDSTQCSYGNVDHGHAGQDHSHSPAKIVVSLDHDHQHSSDLDRGHDHDHGHKSCHIENPHMHEVENCAKHPNSTICVIEDNSHQHIQEHNHCHTHCHGSSAIEDLAKTKSLKDLLSAYTLEISTAIHSIIIGFDLGVLKDTPTISVLLAALCFHQFVEGIGMGAVLKTNKERLSFAKLASFVLIFSLTVPVGVIIGLGVSPEDETDEQLAITATATSIAAGSMLYIALYELAPHYFSMNSGEISNSMRIAMLLTFVVSIAAMGVIGIWAKLILDVAAVAYSAA
jgi:zinc transporter ZupT